MIAWPPRGVGVTTSRSPLIRCSGRGVDTRDPGAAARDLATATACEAGAAAATGVRDCGSWRGGSGGGDRRQLGSGHSQDASGRSAKPGVENSPLMTITMHAVSRGSGDVPQGGPARRGSDRERPAADCSLLEQMRGTSYLLRVKCDYLSEQVTIKPLMVVNVAEIYGLPAPRRAVPPPRRTGSRPGPDPARGPWWTAAPGRPAARRAARRR